jgi:uncharacterized protein YdcH (DUF465 family)
MRIPHELPEEFPDEARFIDQLSRSNHEFQRLVADYNEINQRICRIESEDEPTTDEVLQVLRKRRLKLKDDIAAMLTKLERRM